MEKVTWKAKIAVCTMALFLLAFLFAPAKKAEAAGNYYLQINKGTNVVTVFMNNGTPVHAFVCSTGYATPVGTFYTSQKLRWHTLMGPSYGQYCTRITGSILFHSVFYNRNGDLASMPYSAYNRLGTTASHGCVRLTVADAKWIYENCPLRTQVNIINGAPYNDPLGKPEAIKVNTGASTGWDPTDPAPGNPYAGNMPWITTSGVQKNIAYKAKFSPRNGVAAYDSLGNDVTYRMTYSGRVNTKKLGKYRITYHVTDALGRSAQTSVTYKVVDVKKAVIKGVKKKLTKEYNSTLNLRKNVKARTVTGKNLTKKIKIKIIYPKTKKEKTYKGKVFRFTKLGTYKINYYVTNPNNKKVTKVTCKVTVKDTKPPKLGGIKSKWTQEYRSTKNLSSGVTAKLRSGKNVKSRLIIKIKAPGASGYKKLSTTAYKKYRFSKTGNYYVEYSASNPYNKKAVAKKKATIVVKDTKAPLLNGVAGYKTVQIGTNVNLKAGITAKLVSGKDITGSLQISVKNPQGAIVNVSGSNYVFEQVGNYEVTYTSKNPNSTKVTVRKMQVTVQDNRLPQIIIAENKPQSAEVNTPYNVFEGVTAQIAGTSIPAENITAKIVGAAGEVSVPENGQVTFTQTGTYTITYRVVNPNNPAAATERTFGLTVESASQP
ncbi:MAG: L,D-transpeptidase family protein [Lachnospiraceae bacterium]|nr:L,D-transpeptidase family protein [Lachnospiraceae bacterium]